MGLVQENDTLFYYGAGEGYNLNVSNVVSIVSLRLQEPERTW